MASAALFPPPLPPLISLFSSSTFPSPLWQTATDPQLPDDSLLLLFQSDDAPEPVDRLHEGAALIHVASNSSSGAVAHPVVHLQSPTIRTTFLRCPPKNDPRPLGIGLEWLHFSLRPLGGRELALEVGIVDGRGVRGVVRTSTFTSHPHIKPSSSLSGGPPLLLLPLRLPEPSPSTLTPWAQTSLHLPALLSCFASTPGTAGGAVPVQPRGSAAWEYVKVYANCRIRRLWFSSEREGGEAGRGREELGLWPASGHAGDDEGFL